MKTTADYVEEIQDAHQAKYIKPSVKPLFTFIKGNKFDKVVSIIGFSRSIHCFVNSKTGDIYKAASGKTKAKGIRGNINDDVKPIFFEDYYK
jgi:hypothetical protein